MNRSIPQTEMNRQVTSKTRKVQLKFRIFDPIEVYHNCALSGENLREISLIHQLQVEFQQRT